MSSGYGLNPDPWQLSVLEGWLGVRRDGKWSSPRSGLAVPRQNGKNGLVEMRELFGMVEKSERFLHTAHEVKTARKAFIRLLSFFDNPRQYPELAGLVKEVRRTNGQEAIVLDNGGQVEFIARSKGSGRGFSADVLVMDEAQEMSDDALAALLPTISASPNPQQISIGTPPGPNATAEVWTRLRELGVSGRDNRLCWMEWGCDGEDIDADDVANWALANPALGIRLGYETISDERAAMDDETFARERLGMWSTNSARQVIPLSKWAELADDDSAPVGAVAFAVDIDNDRVNASVAVAGRREDGRLHVEVAAHKRRSDWVKDWIVKRSETWEPVAVVIDLAGPAASLIPELEKAGVPVKTTSAREMGQACGMFYDAVMQGNLRHRDDTILNTSIGSARKRPLGDAWAWNRKDGASDITPLVSSTLALYGFATTDPPVKKHYGAAGF